MVDDAVKCILDGAKDGLTRMEVEFPPIPTKIDGYKGASDLFIDSNAQLSLAAARKIAETGKKVHVVMPDQGEYDRTYKMFRPTLDALGGSVSLGHLKEIGGWSFSLEGMFSGYAPDSKEAGQAADMYIIINATCVELLGVREYINKLAPEGSGKAVVLWNLELDTLRGDLGLPAFPSKDIHYAFLSAFRPVFYLRPRDYSKSVTVAPFIVNYSGALFREYPGPWQVMLRQDSGEYACIAEDRTRYNLGELKEELQAAMGLATEEEGSMQQVLRRGFKNSTWWEDDYDVEKSHEWRL